MAKLNTETLSTSIKEKITPFFTEILEKYDHNIHSIYLVGSVLTKDYIEKVSDINSIIVLKEMDLGFLDLLAPLGKRYRKKGLAAPLLMTPGYIQDSLNVFPIEFLNFKLVHQTIWGEDLFHELEIKKADLLHQCEREIKSKLIWLRQSYISAMGDRKFITENIVRQFTGYIPLFRALIELMEEPPPIHRQDVVAVLSRLTGTETDIFEQIYAMKKKTFKPSKEQLIAIFDQYYRATEKLGAIINELQVQ